jgi:nitrous oxide reductase accessory protein NosL
MRDDHAGKREKGKAEQLRRPCTVSGCVAMGIVVLIAVISLSAPAGGAEKKALKPSPRDKCTVCGMFVAKYPDWVATIAFRDGSVAFFDGPKDLLTYYHDLQRYNPTKKKSDILSTQVSEYYSLEPIDALKAYYVIGSDVYGPMGSELIPFSTETEAAEFLKDHRGKKIVTFRDITPEVLKALQ